MLKLAKYCYVKHPGRRVTLLLKALLGTLFSKKINQKNAKLEEAASIIREGG